MKKYTGDYTQEIAFPLSGIGTGGVSIAGNGRLIDWELDGRANKGGVNEYTHFAVKAERGGRVVDARVLHGDLFSGLGGSPLQSHHHSWGYGQGPNRTSLAGLAHFPEVTFEGVFPFARLEFGGTEFPADIRLEAFNPFIPGNEDDSSLPAAFFDWDITNTSEEKTDYTLAFSVGNPFKISDGGCCTFENDGGLPRLTLSSRNKKPEDEDFGELMISSDCAGYSVQQYWIRSGWFDDVTTFWHDFSSPGRLKNRVYDDDDRRGQQDIGDMCTLAAHFSLNPHETKSVCFCMAWYFPRFVKYWDEEKPSWNHEYVRRFSCAAQVTDYCLENKWRLYGKSAEFRNTLCRMSHPDAVTEAAADNLCVLKSPTCLRLENGEFWAFEGTGAHDGSCEGTCDHVWNYQYALAFLFPRLAREMIETDYRYNMDENGEMAFRTMLPLGSRRMNFRACVDGQMGTVLRFYREWKLSGDDEWLKTWWGSVKKSLEYAWHPANKDRWDPDKSGVITGRQHHTLDVELFGANSWLTGMYLAALKACAEIAAYLGEDGKAAEYTDIFRRGCRYLESELFNGKHYIQKTDFTDRAVLAPFEQIDPGAAGYWNTERNEMKYQFGSGCEIDQMLGQWHASLIGLGDVFDPQNRKTAAKTLYERNFLSMRDVFNPCRIFAANGEKGMLICTWGQDDPQPVIPIPYTQECMTGFEYAAAGLMVQNGLVQEGLEVIRAVRERYDGKKRNPFAEIECGSSYARSLASFALPAIFSGYSYDMVRGEIGFCPVVKERPVVSFWSVDGAWGSADIGENVLTLLVSDGEISLNAFSLPTPAFAEKISSVTCDGKPVSFRVRENKIEFETKITAKTAILMN